MKKKIKDLTIEEFINSTPRACIAENCKKCRYGRPLQPGKYATNLCMAISYLTENPDDLEKEIEV